MSAPAILRATQAEPLVADLPESATRRDGPDWSPTPEERAILFDTHRHRVLRDARLVDVPPSEEIDRVTNLLAQQMGVPMAFLSVIDAERQYLLSSVGFSPNGIEGRSGPLAGSFCKHVLLDARPLIIEDVARSARVQGNTAIDEMGISSYLGAPVTTAGGVRIGAVCVIDHRPRQWSERDVQLVQEHACLAASLVDARMVRADLGRERREKLDILTRITEGFVTLDNDFRVVFANASAARLARSTLHEGLGRTLWEIVPAFEGTPIKAWLQGLVGQPGTYDYEWRGVANPGWFEMRVVVCEEGMSCYIRDITRRKEAEEALAASEARFRGLTNSAPTGIFELDIDGRLIFANEQWCLLAGLTLQEAMGDGWRAAIHPDDLAALASEWKGALRDERDFSVECRYLRPSGEVRWVTVLGATLRDAAGTTTGYIGSVTDVSDLKQIEQQLRTANRRFEDALAGSDIGLWEWDICTGRTQCGDRIPAMFGYAADEWPSVASEWSAMYHPDDRENIKRHVAAHLAGETPFFRCAHRVRTARGDWKWILESGVVSERDEAGAPCLAVGTFVDITEAKSAEARFRLLFEKSGDPLLLMDERGVVDCNEATLRALGCQSKKEVVGVAVSRFFPDVQPGGQESIELARIHSRIARQLGSHRFEWTLRRADGTELPLQASIAPAVFQGRDLILVSWQDMTRQREQERVLREAKEQAEEASRAKSDFLARMSHELRSPLNSVIGFSQLLRSRYASLQNDRDRTFLDRIHANGVHLLGVINNILDISRIESGKLEVSTEPVDLAALVRTTVSQLEGEVHGRPIDLRAEVTDAPTFVTSDEQKLRQVLINLVGNAIKFTASGEVVARLLHDTEGSSPVIEVRDTGIGIAPERLPVIFEPFEQGETGTSRRYEGTGLGLAISRQLCDLLGVELSVTSAPGKGSVFTLRWPPEG